MSLTRSQLRSRIQSNLNDAVGTYFDDAMVNDSIQDGYDEILIETQCGEGVVSINFAGTRLYYDLYNTIPGFWRITRLFNANTNRWLRCVDSRVLDNFRFDWEASNGTPWFAEIVNFRYLGFFPHYTGSITGHFDVFHKIGRDVLSSDSQTPQIPTQFQRVLESYATADLLEGIREFGKAADFWDDYNKIKGQIADFVPSRSLPDHVWQFADLDTPAFRIP